MSILITRRALLAATSAMTLTAAAPRAFAQPKPSAAAGAAIPLRVVKRTLEVNRKPASVFGLLGPGDRPGLTFTEGDDFRVALVNETAEPTIVHWHGLMAPWTQDGVGGKPAKLIAGKESRAFDFPVGTAGTHWMHAHTLQEQSLLAAPLIVRERKPADEQEVVVLLHDFSFTPPEELLARLKKQGGHGGRMMTGSSGGMSGMMDVNDIEYDAYLANDRTLDDPEVVAVERKGRVRLRIINGATATAFTIDTGRIEADLVAVDGQPVQPVRGRAFPVVMGQRVDLVLDLSRETGAVPILALRAGALERTGFILAPAGARVEKIATKADRKGPVPDSAFEANLKPLAPLAKRAADRRIKSELSTSMMSYAWSQSGFERDVRIRKGERIEVAMFNHSPMAHPMHLHGHRFQVIEIDGKRVDGAVRDTVNVRPMGRVTLAFDADNPGTFAFHCHHLYHMASGMMGFFAYDDV